MPVQVPSPQWPPAFSTEFTRGALELLTIRPVLMVVGNPGSNRHLLGRSIVALPEHTGAVWRHTCRHDESDQPYRTAQRLLGRLGGDADTPPQDVVEALRDLALEGPRPGPTLLLVDADFADQASLDVLGALAVEHRLRIVFAATPGTVGAAGRLAEIAERVDLEPLDPTTVGRLLRARFGVPPHTLLVAFAREWSQGSYANLCEIVDLVDAADAVLITEGLVMADRSRLEDARPLLIAQRSPRAAARLGGSESSERLVDLVSLLGEVELDELVRCVEPATIDHAVRHGAVRRIEDVVTMVDVLEAEVVQSAMSADRMAQLWQAHAGDLHRSMHRPESAIRAATWCLAIDEPLSPTLTRASARQANLRGLHDRTAVFTDDAHTAADPSLVQQDRAHALTQLGDTAALTDLLARLDPAAIPEDELLHFVRWTSRIVPEAERPALRDAAIGPGDDAETQRRRTTVVELAETYDRSFAESTPALVRAVRTTVLSGALSPVNEALAYSTLASLQRHGGFCSEAVHSGRAAVALLERPDVDAGPALLEPTREILFMALVSDLDLGGADQVLATYQQLGGRYAVGGRLGALMEGLLAWYRGDLRLGLACTDLFLARADVRDSLNFRGWVLAVQAQCLALLGRVDEAAEVLAASEQTPSLQRRQSDLERRIAQATVHDLLADPEQALEMLTAVVDEAGAHGLHLLRCEALGIILLIDGPRRADSLLQAHDDVADPSGIALIWRTLARAGAAYDFPALVELARRLVQQDVGALAARVAQFTLDAGRRGTDLTAEDRALLGSLASFG